MTEALKKWVDEHPTGVGTMFVDRREATHWLTTFVKEILNRSVTGVDLKMSDVPEDYHFDQALRELVRDFGLEKPK